MNKKPLVTDISTVAEIKRVLHDRLSADMEREQTGTMVAQALLSVIAEKWVGKKVNKRIVEQFRERLAPDAAAREKVHASIDYIAGMANFHCYGFGTAQTYEERVTLFLGYDNEHYSTQGDMTKSRSYSHLTVAGFEENNRCHLTAALERQTARRVLVQNDGLQAIAETIQRALIARADLKRLTEYGTPGSQINYFAQDLADGKGGAR